ncbi:spermidine synthase; polyamine metabolism [Candidatus Hydrogenisulfobacillus filiaventi]|uniref:Polyamine aminopropyltransferase n=1 Tax=Candidatus Hydrogenisulfobacillus filiaventi TaxID=2707344 RepID=A0A6F8ZKN8_9FIRM|nr:polyamine aminopropyltransferase [Bacillota bacterium]CAB1130236.1 spermidine synthase; polyamine metabolism [Candidatus Hydrogenisulfobacillus filiaventi]
MNVWVTEWQTPDVGLSLKVKAVLWQERTPYQELAVVDTEAYGRVLLLDGAIQTTDRDEYVYHEMITHVPLTVHPHPRRVAVIGGGDGGTIREILKHPEVEEVHLVEIDERVVEASRRFFPRIAEKLDDPRVHLHFTDGIAWVRDARNFDVILVDSTDPVGPAEGLFTPAFYASLAAALGPDGIATVQSESPFLQADLIRRIHTGMRASFAGVYLYLANVPTYPSGLWSFTLGSKGPDPGAARPGPAGMATRYWSPEVQAAAFRLPVFVQELVRAEEPAQP